MEWTDKIVVLIGAAGSLLAAVFWLWSSLIDIPDNIDTIVSKLRRASLVKTPPAKAGGFG
jgi:hypothetical protein